MANADRSAEQFRKMTETPIPKLILSLAAPTILSMLITSIYNLADTFFVGQIGDPNQLAALSITFPIFTLLTAVANLFGIGANSVIARSLGKNDQDTAKKASAFGFWASFGVRIIWITKVWLHMDSTNHPAWNSPMYLACIMASSAPLK